MSTARPRGGSTTPLLLLHGLGASWRVWTPVLPALEASHDVIAPTLPGHRDGPATPPGPITVEWLTDWVEAHLDESGIHTVHVAGNSLGGLLALELARRARTRSVTALAPAGGWVTRRQVERVAWMVRAGRRGLLLPTAPLLRLPWLRRVLFLSSMQHADRVPDADLLGMFADARECAITDRILAEVRRHGALRPLNAGDVPVRLAWPEHDKTLPYVPYGANMRRLVAGSEVVMLPGTGHVPMYDDPALVADAILNVTTSVDAHTRRRSAATR